MNPITVLNSAQRLNESELLKWFRLDRESFDRLTQYSRASPDRKHEMISELLWVDMFLRSIYGNLDRQGFISDTEQ